MASHASCLPAQVAALGRGLYDASVSTSLLLVLSVCYHRTHESNAAVARVELCSTAALFVYGLMHVCVCEHVCGTGPLEVRGVLQPRAHASGI